MADVWPISINETMRLFKIPLTTFLCGLLAGSYFSKNVFREPCRPAGFHQQSLSNSKFMSSTHRLLREVEGKPTGPLENLDSNEAERNNCTCTSAAIKIAKGEGDGDGLEKLPSRMIEAYSDMYLRRQWGAPEEDLRYHPRGLLVIAAGLKQKQNVDAMIKKFPEENFTRVIFHYDNAISEWSDLEWSERAVHVGALQQTKWWFAKRFLHPAVVQAYDYIFLWDEDLGIDNFHGTRYMEIVEKHSLQISQPAIDNTTKLSYPITRRQPGSVDVHHFTSQSRSWRERCDKANPVPPCGGFVEIMAPVFSRRAWRCVWHMIQNDLVHGWGIDFQLGSCVEGLPHESIGVVDKEWIVHQSTRSLGKGLSSNLGEKSRDMVRSRCQEEFRLFRERWEASVV